MRLLFILLLFPFFVYSQTIMSITYEQAQKIDNSFQLNNILSDQLKDCDFQNNLGLILIDELTNETILLYNYIEIKDSLINNHLIINKELEKIILNKEHKNILLNDELVNKKREIRKLYSQSKFHKHLAYISTIISVVLIAVYFI